MTFQEYKEQIRDSLAKYVRDQSQEERYTELVLGLYEEAAEITSLIRRTIKGNYHEKPIDLEHLSEEVGDVLWYISHISMQLPEADLPKTDIKDYYRNINKTYKKEVPNTQQERLRYFCLGLITEVGEVAEQFGENRINGVKLDTSKIEEKLNESLRYLTAICDTYGLDLEQIANNNIEKVYSRYKKDGTLRNNTEER